MRHEGPNEPFEAPPMQAVAAERSHARLFAAVILIGCVSVLGIAAKLTPNPNGYGTHTQLGMKPCGMLVVTGLPCPTCGMTTAFAYTVRGNLYRAFLAQPGGLALALISIYTSFLCIQTLITGRPPIWLLFWLTPFRLSAILLLILVGGWAFCLIRGLATGALPAHSITATR